MKFSYSVMLCLAQSMLALSQAVEESSLSGTSTKTTDYPHHPLKLTEELKENVYDSSSGIASETNGFGDPLHSGRHNKKKIRRRKRRKKVVPFNPTLDDPESKRQEEFSPELLAAWDQLRRELALNSG
ncbi:unnamed protein product [Notodromas monacha]|uniref:Uncharacterized protein n=1 Tax=Notodromas monacha TaxID=399045 RepID=A0A7R9BYW7_9CRUS|nr:unnamed protein product [Notodromas monacha]CAG0923222.1 unnamed protein product [Notodromas monacha]